MKNLHNAAIGGIIVGLCAAVALGAAYAFLEWGNKTHEQVVYTVHCDDELIARVTPPSHLSAVIPRLDLEGEHRGVTWYDATNTKHWVDVSHCGYVQIKPWKMAKSVKVGG